MKFDITIPVKDYLNNPVKTTDKDKKECDLLWREVIDIALNTPLNTETLSTEDKTKCYRLSIKAYGSDEISLNMEERVYLLERIRKVFVSPLICGRADEYFGKDK